MKENYNYFDFSSDVLRTINKKLWEYAGSYTDEVDNTRLPFLQRTHFLSTNITSIINRIFHAGTFTISTVKYRIDDYDEEEIGEEKLYQNRQDFLKEIENCDNILSFIFITFRLS